MLPDITLSPGCDLQATLQFVSEHEKADVRRLALEAPRQSAIDLPFALDQIAGRQKATTKLPAWAATQGIIYPPSISLEQCSSQATASYKAALVQGEVMIDLTGGFGVDCSFMASRFKRAYYVERNLLLCDIARHNFALLGLNHVQVVNAQAEDCLASLPQASLIYLDPARRDAGGNRVFRLQDCTPDVTALLPQLLSKSPRILLKLSPMLDVQQALRELHCVSDIHIVSVNGECKELLLLLSAGYDGEVHVHCINDNESFTYSLNDTPPHAQEWNPDLNANEDHIYLYEPNASIMKAGCFDHLAQQFPVLMVARNSHLFVSTTPLPHFPGRKFIVNHITTLNDKRIKQQLGSLKQANVAVRNFPIKANELRKRLRLNDGGDTYIFATRLTSGKNVLLLCHKTTF